MFRFSFFTLLFYFIYILENVFYCLLRIQVIPFVLQIPENTRKQERKESYINIFKILFYILDFLEILILS